MGFVRIIAGRLRGRRIPVPDISGLRPTSERVREALFNILGSWVEDASVLDAFSGTGALGFEALSRGARHATFLESNSDAARRIELAAKRFAVDANCRVIAGPVVSSMSSRLTRFALILADPPYGGSETIEFLRRAPAHLSSGGILVLEREFREDPARDGLPLLVRTRTSRYGRTALDFFGHRGEAGPPFATRAPD